MKETILTFLRTVGIKLQVISSSCQQLCLVSLLSSLFCCFSQRLDSHTVIETNPVNERLTYCTICWTRMF